MSLTNEQIEARKKTIGGSDIGAILGENNYKTAYELWEEKVEGKSVDLSRNKSVVIGNLLEGALLLKYTDICDSIIETQGTLYKDEYKFLSANVDGISFQRDINLKSITEIKTASCFNKDEWGPTGSQLVPKQYYAQVAYYMLVADKERADIFVGFIDDNIVGEILCEMNLSIQEGREANYLEIVNKMETRLYTFHRDEEIEKLILEAAIDFYEKHMRPWIEHGIKTPPPMDFSNKKFQDHVRKKYLIQEDSVIKLPNEFMAIKNNYVDFMLQSKYLEKLAQEEKSKILEAIGNNQKATLYDGSYFLRKTIKRKEGIVKASEYIKLELKQPKGEI